MAILAVGGTPIVVGLSIAYVNATSELREVIGASFTALAQDSALKIDTEIQRLITHDRFLAQQAGADARVIQAFSTQSPASVASSAVMRLDWTPSQETENTRQAVLASWVTPPASAPEIGAGDSENNRIAAATGKISGLYFDVDRSRYAFRVSTPITREGILQPFAWLHREYDAKMVLDPLIYPIRFGETGHVMVIDNLGVIVSCPDLVTGSRIDDTLLVSQIATDRVGWITAQNDGHGSQVNSLVGHAPLSKINLVLEPDVSWHMFVWQDSREIFLPARTLMTSVAYIGLISIGLLSVLGYYVSSRIVTPIRRLREQAARIAAGNLKHELDIRTGDEIEELAGEFNQMRIQLTQFIGGLEEMVEERTRELKNAQAEKDSVVEQLIQSEKITTIANMASGIGHEINNPLYVILGRAEAIQDAKDVSKCQQAGRDIIKYVRQISETVSNLSGYVRPGSAHDLADVDVNEKLSDAISMATQSRFSVHIEIRKNFTAVPSILAKPEEIQQIFFNIILNGMQAMQGKGILEISSREEGGFIRVAIQDQGSGIPEENLGKIFDPFFTTKGPDEGDGLGLFIVEQILKKYDGKITVQSQEGAGSICNVQLPIGARAEGEKQDVT